MIITIVNQVKVQIERMNKIFYHKISIPIGENRIWYPTYSIQRKVLTDTMSTSIIPPEKRRTTVVVDN